MPCIKTEHTGLVPITMPLSPSIGTPIYHYHAIRISKKTWDALSSKVQQVYKSKMLSLQANSAPNKVSYIQLFLISDNNKYEPVLLRAGIIERELELSDSDNYDNQTLIDSFMKYMTKHQKKIRWSAKNLCI